MFLNMRLFMQSEAIFAITTEPNCYKYQYICVSLFLSLSEQYDVPQAAAVSERCGVFRSQNSEFRRFPQSPKQTNRADAADGNLPSVHLLSASNPNHQKPTQIHQPNSAFTAAAVILATLILIVFIFIFNTIRSATCSATVQT